MRLIYAQQHRLTSVSDVTFSVEEVQSGQQLVRETLAFAEWQTRFLELKIVVNAFDETQMAS